MKRSHRRLAEMTARRKAREARKGRRTRCCRWFCIRLAIVALGSVFSAVLLIMSHMESVQHGKSFAVSHAGSAVHRPHPEVFERRAKPTVHSLLRGNDRDDGKPQELEEHYREGERFEGQNDVPPDEVEEEIVTPPSLEEIIATLRTFLDEVHRAFGRARRKTREEVWAAYVGVAEAHLLPFERRIHRSKRPVRTDGSVFISIAAYRDHMLANTLTELFTHASKPELVIAGVVQQNCEVNCRTGVQVVSQPGEPVRTKVSDAPADKDGVAEFCASELGAPHCKAGRVRVLRVNESESIGPAFARYLASKLWLGEQFYVQIDAHMWARDAWDDELRAELMATPSYPRSVMSAYPPPEQGSWQNAGSYGKLCSATFSTSPVEAHILRLSGGGGGRSMAAPEPEPPRSICVGAGFFAAHASFLQVAPFDPFLPFVFMGEEIMLTTRFYTNGFDVYSPRKNLFAHQYRPGRMGLPKFWETQDRTFGSGGSNTRFMLMIVDRVKALVGYTSPVKNPAVLKHVQDADGPNYGLGTVRSLPEFLAFAGLDMVAMTSRQPAWCARNEYPPN